MKWLINTFYLHPLPVVLLTLAAYVSVAVIYFVRGTERIIKSAFQAGLRPVALNPFLQHINNSKDSCLGSDFDGSKFGMPLIEGIFTGTYEGFSVSLFQFVLPTGRSGTWQTVVHIRSATETLPDISIKDPTYSSKLSDLLNLRSKFRFRDTFIESEYEYRAGQAGIIADKLKKIERLVVDASGRDLFFYLQGKTAEPVEWKNLTKKGISLFKMISSGNVDVSIIEESQAEKAYSLYIGAKTMLLSLPGFVMIFLIGYGNKILLTILCVSLFLFFGLAKARYDKYRDVYP